MKAKTGTSIGGRSRVSFACLVVATALVSAAPGTQAQESDAKAVLKAMSDYVSSQKTIELTFE